MKIVYMWGIMKDIVGKEVTKDFLVERMNHWGNSQWLIDMVLKSIENKTFKNYSNPLDLFMVLDN
jgi:hypothetical protein